MGYCARGSKEWDQMMNGYDDVHYCPVPSGVEWIRDIAGMTDLPDNCLFNKQTTGSGMTTFAMASGRKYVIAMPYVTLIRNKQAVAKKMKIDHLAIYASENQMGDEVKDINGFKGNLIMVTYDQLERVMQELPRSKDWKLLVDEAHVLVRDAPFRTAAVKSVLNSYLSFGSFVFGSATIHNKKYQLSELKDLPYYVLEWEAAPKVKLTKVVCEDLYDQVKKIGNQHIKGSIDGNAHIFINSVEGVIALSANWKAKDVRIICARSERNYEKLIRANKSRGKALGNLTIGDVTSEPAKINFYTSTAFEGVDVSDTEGRTYIVADGTKDYTKVDISSTLNQIVGRLRDSKYKYEVKFLYKPTYRALEGTEEEYRDAVMKSVRFHDEWLQQQMLLVRNGNDVAWLAVKEMAVVSQYLVHIDDEVKINQLAIDAEMANWSTWHNTYYVNPSMPSDNGFTLKVSNGVTYEVTAEEPQVIDAIDKADMKKRFRFDEMCEIYCNEEDQRASIDKIEPSIGMAFDKLGATKMKALEYRRDAIERYIVAMDKQLSVKGKIVKLMKFKIGSVVTKSWAKTQIQKVYDAAGHNAKAKSTDINIFCNTKLVKRRIKGVPIDVYEIVSMKV